MSKIHGLVPNILSLQRIMKKIEVNHVSNKMIIFLFPIRCHWWRRNKEDRPQNVNDNECLSYFTWTLNSKNAAFLRKVKTKRGTTVKNAHIFGVDSMWVFGIIGKYLDASCQHVMKAKIKLKKYKLGWLKTRFMAIKSLFGVSSFIAILIDACWGRFQYPNKESFLCLRLSSVSD